MNPYAMQDRMQAEREDAEAAFEAWCERNDVDPDDADASDAFERAMEDAAEDAAEARAEAMADRDW